MTHLRGVKPALTRDRDPLTKAPPAPKYFTTYAKSEWKRVMPRLIEDRIITKADLGGIEDFCVARGHIREIEDLFRATGGPPDKVLFGMQNRAMQTARQLAAEYGLSPTSRARVQGQTEDEDDDNPLEVA
ncbi:phage terminase small subunit P27 family [Phyllobacterium zundukense]|uniref:Terminase n=1 Tax=Phyllobacterium zundukense TaxID=1867719 RepID=A0A2N9W455_9HYPH|nr:phage terminase small subunit P27 family [Phyllobacterium zundukense]ATU92007.1 terminase [Phyllobacterium zundukense]PIO46523.1 terminase [Phyllobacterium zundukense]